MTDDHQTPGQRRLARARETRRRTADDRMAADLRTRGWLVIEPENAHEWRVGALASADSEGR